MNLADFLDEVWAVLDTVPDLNIPDDQSGSASPPTAYLELPDVTYGEYGPGLDRITDYGLTVVFGPANNELVFRTALEAASTTGARSIPRALRLHTWTTVHTLYVKSAEPTSIERQGSNRALAYVFHLDISGAP